MLKVVLIILAILLLLGYYPIRVAVLGNLRTGFDLQVFLYPLPFAKWRCCIFTSHKDNPLGSDQAASKPSADIEGIEGIDVDLEALQAKAAKTDNQPNDELRAKFEASLKAEEKKVKAEEKAKAKTEKTKISLSELWRQFRLLKGDTQQLIYRLLGYLRVEQLEVRGNFPGDPAMCAFGCGVLWSFFGFGYGYLSSKVRKFSHDAKMDFTLNSNQPWEGDFKGQAMLRLGNILVLVCHVLVFMFRHKLFKKQKKQAPVAN